MDRLPPLLKKCQPWLIFATLIFGTYAGAAAIGLQIPRPAWIGEHLALAGEVKQNRVKLYEGKVESLVRQLASVEVAASRVKRGSAAYSSFVLRAAQLKSQLVDARAKLSRARGF